MTITLAPMLAIIGLSGGELILIFFALMLPVVIAALVISIVLFVLKRKKTETPVPPPAIPPARKRTLWFLLAVLVVGCGGIFLAFLLHKHGSIETLNAPKFYQLLNSHRIIAATITYSPRTPLYEVAGTYKKDNSDGGYAVIPFRVSLTLMTDQEVNQLMSLPNSGMVEKHPVGISFLSIFLVLLVLLILAALVVLVMVRLMSGNRPALRVPPAIPPIVPVQPSARKCPKCGAPLRPDVPEGLCPACLLQHGIATEGGAPPGTPVFTPPPLLELAKLFPQLEILEIIGQGGMGAVYKARQPSLDRFVALKILAPRSGGDLDFAGRFSREARALAKLNHPNIVGVYDYGTVGQASSPSPSEKSEHKSETGRIPVLHYFIMEYVDGPNLRQVEQAGKLTPREALQIIPQICAALQFAHDEGIVHRDIKPENVLLDKKGRVKIADFGLAKILGQEADFRLTGARDVMGTPHYMAPEQVEKPQEVDHRADIYSLGVVFYEMLTGELPLGKFDPPSHKVQIDVRLDDVVLRSLANNPDRRYQNVSDVKTELESIAHTSGPRATVPPSESTHFLRTGLGIAIGAFAAVLLIAFLGLFAGIAIPNFIRARNEARSHHPVTQAQTNDSNAVPEMNIATNPPASAETWTPTFAPGEKPDLQKILNEADDLMKRGQYEQALGRHIWLQLHQTEYGGSVQNISALSSWIELGHRFPKAKQALIEIRDNEVREFAEGRGYTDLFRDIVSINQQLQDEDATYELFKAIRKGDPRLADQCYFWVEGLLIAKGEYQFCYDHLGDPQSRLAQAKQNFEMQISMFQRSAANQERSRQQVAEFNRQHGITNLPPPAFPDTSNTMLNYATNAFVGTAGMLIEVLLGTGHAIEAQHLRDQALEIMPDPRLESAITDAESRIQKRTVAPRDPSATDRPGTNSAYANLKIPAPGEWHPTVTNIPDASRESWEPTLDAGAKPDLMAILQEAKELMSKGLYEEALQREIWYHTHSFSDPGQLGVRNSFALSDWVELGRRYPKAMQALLEIRNENERKISSGEGNFDLFMETAAMNRELGRDESTRTLFKQLAASPDKNLAKQCYSLAEGVLVSHGDYELCMSFIGQPESRLKNLQEQWQRSKKWEQQQDDMRRQMDERMHAAQKQSESNGIASASWPRSMIPSPPKSADKTFVAQTRQLIAILVGAGHKTDAGNIQREAVLLLDDPALKSAVDDAEKKIHAPKQSTPPTSGFLPRPVVQPPVATPPPPGNVIRPLRALRLPQTNSTLTPEEQVALIEIQRIKSTQEADPIARLLPSSEFTASTNSTNHASQSMIHPLSGTPVSSTNRP